MNAIEAKKAILAGKTIKLKYDHNSEQIFITKEGKIYDEKSGIRATFMGTLDEVDADCFEEVRQPETLLGAMAWLECGGQLKQGHPHSPTIFAKNHETLNCYIMIQRAGSRKAEPITPADIKDIFSGKYYKAEK